MILACALIAVIDGDTLDAACPHRLRIRLANIDAPEARACPLEAASAKRALFWLAQGNLAVFPLYQDRYGRTVAHVSTASRDLGAALVATGHARPWPHDNRGRALAPRPEEC